MIAQIHLPGYLIHADEKKWQFIIIFAVFVLQYFFEHIFPQNKNYNNVKNEGKNILVGVLNAALLFIPSAMLTQLLYLTDKYQIGLLHFIQLPLWVNIIVTIITMDIAMYFWHRLNHTQPLFWRFHQFHHKDTRMNTSTAVRFHIIELLFSSLFKSIFFLALGFSFLPILIYETIFFIVVVIHHSNINITVKFDMLYRRIFSSPLMHRIHHSNIKEETDTNYGAVFSFWDILFNSYKKEAKGKIIFGVDEESL